jgi:hypothetical protein
MNIAINGNTVYQLPYLLKQSSYCTFIAVEELYVITLAVIIKISLKGCAFVIARAHNAL